MKAFDLNAVCPKCRCDAIYSKHTTHWNKENNTDEEMMQRTCSGCNYVWEERPADHEEDD